MGHKHPGKITKKFVSVLAASAMLTTQIPANLSAGAANTDIGPKTLTGSISASDIINITSDKIMETNNATITTSPVATTSPAPKAAASSDAVTSAPAKAAASATTTTTTTTTKATVSSTTVSTIPESQRLQPDPEISLSHTVAKPGSTVALTIKVNDANFAANDEYYSNATIYVDLDSRLTLKSVESGKEDGTAGMYVSYSSYSPKSSRKTYGIYASSSTASDGTVKRGKNGTFATLNLEVPADAKPKDVTIISNISAL